MYKISQALLNWYDQHHRVLPWRTSPKNIKIGLRPTPYHVWLSEIMLQQTTVEAVKPYFEKFLKSWPDVFSLARASQDDVMKAWTGLGYYSRARNLKKCADQLVDQFDGVFPQTLKQLRSLAGIGEYTAAAISAIAFNQAVGVVDGNVERVVSRLFAITTPFPKAKLEVKEKTQNITPLERPGDFAQAMMDLGANICKPRNPLCQLCPLTAFCLARKTDRVDVFPVKPAKKLRPHRQGTAFVAISRFHKIYLEKRHDKGLLGGMTQIPNHFGVDDIPSVKNAPFAGDWQFSGQIEHIFTHFSLRLDVYLAENIDEKSVGNGWWCELSQLQHEALPTVMKKAINQALKDCFK